MTQDQSSNQGIPTPEAGKDEAPEVFQPPSPSDEGVPFHELYEQSLQNVRLGEIVTGKIVQIGNDAVMVDVGWKTEGYIPSRELRDKDGNVAVEIGETIEVLVDRRDADGNLVLSKEKAERIKIWDHIRTASEQGLPIQGTVVERVKGGLSVDVGLHAFLPGSQVDVHPVRDLERYIGQTMDFEVIKFDRKRNNIVVSRRTLLERERQEEKQKTLETLAEGNIVEGVVKNITEYGVFIDLGGIDGLLHITDISWGRVTRPSERFSRGQKLQVKVLSFDPERERVALGLKQLIDNPWEQILERYPVGAIVEGKVVNLTDYGAFVELEPGVEGLVHITEMFWTREIRHPSKVLTLNQTVRVMVLDVNTDTKRISLGLKQTMPNPWLSMKDKYPEGTVVRGIVRNITNFGVFVGIEDGIDGLIHVSDISWKHRVNHPSEYFKKGQEVTAVVLNVDVEKEKFSLGIKQLERNPWEEVTARFAPGAVVKGKVTNITDFGVFVEIEEGIEGLVHISEFGPKRTKASAEAYAIGDVISATIKSMDTRNKRIRLTIKDAEAGPSEHAAHRQYINNREHVGSNLGQALADMKITLTENGTG